MSETTDSQPQPEVRELEAELARLLPAGGLVCRHDSRTLTVDPVRKVMRFENFSFVTAFASNPVRPVEEVAFREILGRVFAASQVSFPRQPTAALGIRTTKGQVTLDSRFEHYDALEEIVDAIIDLNEANPEQHRKNLALEPVVKTAWYGWVLLLVAVGAVVYFGWKLMYRD